MSEEVDPSVIQTTKDILSRFVTKPPLSEKLLKKPPFKFLHDVIMTVVKDHGLMVGLFNATESNSENVKDKPSKLAFIQKVIDVIEFVGGEKLSVRPSKIVAGLEVNKTNLLLQAIGKALANKTDSSEAVSKVLSGEKFGGSKKSSKSKERSSSPKKSQSGGSSGQGVSTVTDKKPSADRKPTTTKPVTEDKDVKKSRSRSSDKDKDPKKHRSSKDKDKEKSKGESSDKPSKKAVNGNDEKPETEHKKKRKSDGEASKKEKDKTSKTKKSSSKSDGEKKRQREETEVNGGDAASTRPSTEPAAAAVQLPEDQPAASDRLPPAAVTEHEEHVVALNDMEAGSFTAGDGTGSPAAGFSAPRPRTGVRSARPSSARPAAPRPRAAAARATIDQPLDDAPPAAAAGPQPSAAATVLLDRPEDDQDDEDRIFVVEEKSAPPDMGTVPDGDSSSLVSQAADGQHGRLVSQLLEAKRTMEQQIAGRKDESEKDLGGGQMTSQDKEAVRKEVARLRESIQKVTKSANPLGKMMDFLQEDVDSMQRELDRWRQENRDLAQQIRQEQETTDRAVDPLRSALVDYQQRTDDQLDRIAAARAAVLLGAQRLEKLMAGVVSLAEQAR